MGRSFLQQYLSSLESYLDIVGCISDDGYDLMDGFINKLTKKDILDHFRLKHGRRNILTQNLIDSLNNN